MTNQFMTDAEFDKAFHENVPPVEDWYIESFSVEVWVDEEFTGVHEVELESDSVNLSDPDEVFDTIIEQFNEGASNIIVRTTIKGQVWTAWVEKVDGGFSYTIDKP